MAYGLRDHRKQKEKSTKKEFYMYACISMCVSYGWILGNACDEHVVE